MSRLLKVTEMFAAPPLERLVPKRRVLAVVNLMLKVGIRCDLILRHIRVHFVRSLATGAENVLSVRPKARPKERKRKLACHLRKSMSPLRSMVNLLGVCSIVAVNGQS